MAELPKSKMRELAQKDISKELDKKVSNMEISDALNSLVINMRKTRDVLNKPNKMKAKAGLKTGGRAGFKSGSKGCKLAMKGKGRAYGKNS